MLIENLSQNDSLINKCPNVKLVVVLNQDSATIATYIADYFQSFPFYTNTMLNFKAKHPDFTPQLYLYKGEKLHMYIRGVRKGMLSKALKKAGCLK